MEYLRTALFIFPDREPTPDLLLQALAAEIDDRCLAFTIIRGLEEACGLLEQLTSTAAAPDVVLVAMPAAVDAALARLEALSLAAPGLPIVAWLDSQDPEIVLRLMEAGASDCLLRRTASATMLADALGLASGRAMPERVERIDPLTGLLSQRALIEHVGRLLERRRQQPDFQFAILAVDVADFYAVRQRLGRPISEQLLVTLGRRLMASARPLDAVGRLPDAEFVLVMPQLERDSDAWSVAWRLESRLTAPIRLEDENLNVSTRWGITLSGDAFDGPHDMLGAAILESKTF